MGASEDINGILIALKVAGNQALLIMLGSDGSINRQGTGAANNAERDMFIGVTQPHAFQQLRGRITDALLQWCGQSLSAPEKRGQVCELTVGFQRGDGQELMAAFEYGSESQGPPPEVCNFVVAAVEATTPWYEQQKAMVSKANLRAGKKWWQFWR